MESFKPLLGKVAAGANLSRAEAAAAFDAMLSGEVTPAQMGGFLMGLRVRGEMRRGDHRRGRGDARQNAARRGAA